MITKYLIVFLISMVPLIELRGAIPYAVAFHIPTLPAYLIAVIGNMLPVPIIFLFARKVLVWGCDKKVYRKNSSPGVWKKAKKGGEKTESKSRSRTSARPAALRRHPAPGNRRMDRHTGRKYPRYGL